MNFSTHSSNEHDLAAFYGQCAQLWEEITFQPEFNEILQSGFEIPQLEETPMRSSNLNNPTKHWLWSLAALGVQYDCRAFYVNLSLLPRLYKGGQSVTFGRVVSTSGGPFDLRLGIVVRIKLNNGYEST